MRAVAARGDDPSHHHKTIVILGLSFVREGGYDKHTAHKLSPEALGVFSEAGGQSRKDPRKNPGAEV